VACRQAAQVRRERAHDLQQPGEAERALGRGGSDGDPLEAVRGVARPVQQRGLAHTGVAGQQ
jgi:hypothetical protein